MDFRNKILLLGALAFLIPLMIHLLNRRRLKVVHWGAMHLLEEIVRQKRRRVKIENWLLLLLRILLPILLALCLARPVLTKIRSFMGSQKSSAVILLDDSYSMGFGEADSRAVEAVSGILQRLPEGSDTQVVFMGSGSGTLFDDPTTDPKIVEEALGAREGFGDAAEVTRALRDAGAALSEMDNGAREVIIVSDFQKRDWTAEARSRETALAELEGMDVPPEITLMPVGAPDPENLAITSVQPSSLIVGVNQEFVLRVDLQNFGKRPRSGLPVELLADGEVVDSKTLKVAAGGLGQAIFRHTFESPGAHAIEVRAGTDAIPEDNEFHLALDVRDKIGVCIADGDWSDRPLESESSFLELALRPFASTGSEDLSDLVEINRVRDRDLQKYHYEKGQVLILANVEKFEGNRLGEVRSWVHDLGGTVLVFPGDEVDVNYYNEALYEPGNFRGIFPARIGSLEQARNAGGPARVHDGIFGHPALAYFNNPGTGDFSAIRFHTWYRLEIPERPAGQAPRENDPPPANVLMRFDTGDPLLIEQSYGRGRVLTAAVPCDADWGNFPAQPLFLPFTQRLVSYMASASQPSINLGVGQALRCLPGEDWRGNEVVVVDPGGVQHEVELEDHGGRRTAQFTATAKPGAYTALAKDAGEKARPQIFAVNYAREESDPEPLDATAIEELAEEMGARVARGIEAYAQLDRNRRFGQEIWKPVLWALLIFLFGEIFLQQWLGRARA